MMPQTVPNRPMNGAVEPTEARKIIHAPCRSISRWVVTAIARSTRSRTPLRLMSAPATRRLRRHSVIAAPNTAAIGCAGLAPSSLVQLVQAAAGPEPVLERLGGAIDAPQAVTFSNTIAQTQTLARSSPIMTSLTTMSAWRNRLQIDRSPCAAQISPRRSPGPPSLRTSSDHPEGFPNHCQFSAARHRGGMPRRTPDRRPHACQPDLQHHQVRSGSSRSGRLDCSSTDAARSRQRPRHHEQRIVETRRVPDSPLLARRTMKISPCCAAISACGTPSVAQRLGARALGETQIVGVIDDARRHRYPRIRAKIVVPARVDHC